MANEDDDMMGGVELDDVDELAMDEDAAMEAGGGGGQ